MQSPCGNKVSTQNFVSGSLLSIRVSPSMTARVVFFKRYAPFMIFAHKRLYAVLFVGDTKSRRDVILATRGEFGGVTLVYSS